MGKHNDKYDVIELGDEEFIMVPFNKMSDYKGGCKKEELKLKEGCNVKKHKEEEKETCKKCNPMRRDFFKDGTFMNPYVMNMMCMNSYLMMNMMNGPMNFAVNTMEERDLEEFFGNGMDKYMNEDCNDENEPCDENYSRDYDENHKCKSKCNIEQVVKKIESNNSDIIRTMMNYGMPIGAIRNQLFRIVKATIRYCDYN